MKMLWMLIALVLSALVVGWSLRGVRTDPVPQVTNVERESGPLERAQAEAQAASKVLLVNFFAGSFQPSTQFETEIWQHPALREWIAAHAIDLRFDTEKEVALAQQYRIGPYPTLLILKSDGSEIDRVVGFRQIPVLLEELQFALQGRTSLVRAKEKLAGKEDDPMERGRYGDALATAGRFEEALTEYLWCFDNGREFRGYGGVRLSFLLGDIEDLGKQYPAAIRALEDRRDAAESRVREASSKSLGPRDQKLAIQISADIHDAESLNKHLGTPERTLSLYEDTWLEGRPNIAARSAFSMLLLEPLTSKRRYQEALDLFDKPEGYVTSQFGVLEMASKMSPGAGTEVLRSRATTSGCLIYEALVGTQKGDRASKLAETILASAPSATTYVELIEAASRAGAIESARGFGARGIATFTGNDAAVIRDALDRLPK